MALTAVFRPAPYSRYTLTAIDQSSFGEGLLSGRRMINKLIRHLDKFDQIIDWQPLVREISMIDKTDARTGGRLRKNPLWMIKATFLQSLFSLIDPQLEDQLIDRLNFQRLVGIRLDREIPNFTTAKAPDSTQMERLICYNEKALFGDKTYGDQFYKYPLRKHDWNYGVLDKAKRNQPLHASQKKRNLRYSRVRTSSLEHPFAWMKTKANLVSIRGKNEFRNRLRFVFACIGWNLSRARFLLERSNPL